MKVQKQEERKIKLFNFSLLQFSLAKGHGWKRMDDVALACILNFFRFEYQPIEKCQTNFHEADKSMIMELGLESKFKMVCPIFFF